jgi:translation initiation factor 2B subunit (eIF-2B alpha/beta/delta family)
MTEWREWPSWRRLAAIARAPITGAAAAGSLAATNLADLVESIGKYAPEAYPRAVKEISLELIDRQPAIAPLVTIVNAVFLHDSDPPEALAAELRRTADRMAASASVLSRVGAALVPAGASVLTAGGSGSVRDLLMLAGDSRSFSVACAETMPYGEGIELAADLAAAGLRVEVLPDEQVADAVPGIDLVIVGAAAVGPDAAMNAVGTARIAERARYFSVPVYLVASIDKALPAPLFERAVAAGSAAGQFEPVPLASVSAVVTELGILEPLGAGKLASERSVARALLR